MDKQIDARFDRLDKALATLTDSIAKYNPGHTQSAELMAAEADLNKGLQELQTHQQNHRRIEELRALSASLDAQIKDTLIQLAQARKELKQTPATIFPSGPNYGINYDELLNFARRISRNTKPPSHVLNPIIPPESQPQLTSGTDTAAPTPSGTPNGVISTPQQDPVNQQAANSTVTSLPEPLNAHLNPMANADFVPWPVEDKIRQGSLAMLQYLREKGIDPEGYDPVEEDLRKKREEEEAREREEKERLEREEAERKAREERAARAQAAQEAARNQASAALTSASPVGEKKQFQFMDDDDDESD